MPADDKDSKISQLPFYDTLSIDKDDLMVIVDSNLAETDKVTLGDLANILKEYDIELSDTSLSTLSNNRDSVDGISWVVNPQVYTPGYVSSSTIIPRTPLPDMNIAGWDAPFKIKFKSYKCCDHTWPTLPHVVLRPSPTPPTPTYESVMTIQYCNGTIATVTFSQAYLGKHFIFIDENGTAVSRYNSGAGGRLTFKEGIVQI